MGSSHHSGGVDDGSATQADAAPVLGKKHYQEGSLALGHGGAVGDTDVGVDWLGQSKMGK